MNAEIVAVGSEMLTPTKLDTNSLFLTERLNLLGVEVTAKSVVGDDRARLTAMIAGAFERASILILTGGLGPTEDDVTRDAVAAALGIEQRFDATVCDAIAARFARLGRRMAEINKRQAWVLDGAEVLDNPNGTAPGQWLPRRGKVVMLVPGPPREMKPMFDGLCMPRLKAMLPPMAIATSELRVAGMGESDCDALIAPVYTRYANPVTTILASISDIQILLRANAQTVAEAQSLCDELGAKLATLLGDRIYSTDGATLDAAVGRTLAARGQTVGVAESCTGGMLGVRLTDTPGSSAWFRGGYIVYGADAKRALIGQFDEDPVSEAVARRLAAAARERTGATYGLSITGEAGPNAANPEIPVGTLWLGCADEGSTEARLVQSFGDRDRIRKMAAQASLNLLRMKLAGHA